MVLLLISFMFLCWGWHIYGTPCANRVIRLQTTINNLKGKLMNTLKNIITVAAFASLTIACGASTQGSIQPIEHSFQTMTDNTNFDTSVSTTEPEAEVVPKHIDEDVNTLRTSDSTVEPIVPKPVLEKPCRTVHCSFSVPSIERPSISFGFENPPTEPAPVMPASNNAVFGVGQL